MSDGTTLPAADRYKATLLFGPIVGIIVGGLRFGDSNRYYGLSRRCDPLVTIYPALVESVVENLWDEAE